jgi:hypothetical protein
MVMGLAPAASYDVLNGFEPIIKTATQPLVLVANPGVGVKSVPEMIAAAKSGKTLSYASPGAGSPMHFLGEWLNKRRREDHARAVPRRRPVGDRRRRRPRQHRLGDARRGLAVHQHRPPGAAGIGDARRSRWRPTCPRWWSWATRTSWSARGTASSRPRARRLPSCTLLNGHLNEILKSPKWSTSSPPTAPCRPAARPTSGQDQRLRVRGDGPLIKDLNIRPTEARRTAHERIHAGHAVPQVNARAKVLGRAQYAGDIQLPGMLHGKVLRSPYPHARIVRIDVSNALALPGVKAVITGATTGPVPWGVHHKERLTLRVRRGALRRRGSGRGRRRHRGDRPRCDRPDRGRVRGAAGAADARGVAGARRAHGASRAATTTSRTRSASRAATSTPAFASGVPGARSDLHHAPAVPGLHGADGSGRHGRSGRPPAGAGPRPTRRSWCARAWPPCCRCRCRRCA